MKASEDPSAVLIPYNSVFTHKKPDWDQAKKFVERPIWEIAALACDIEPLLGIVKTRKTTDPEWASTYREMLVCLKDALSPDRGVGVYYDERKPANKIRLAQRETLRFVHGDVVDAIDRLELSFGGECLPKELISLKIHLRPDAANNLGRSSDGILNSAVLATDQGNSTELAALKSQLRAAKSASSRQITSLSLMLYAVMKGAFNYDPDDSVGVNDLMKEVENHFKNIGIENRDGISVTRFKDALHRGIGETNKS